MTDRLPLPNPWAYCYSFETNTSQHLSFSANKYNGAPPSRSVPIYTADQMRQYADDANAALRAEIYAQQKVIVAYEQCNPPWVQELREQVRVLREVVESAAAADVFQNSPGAMDRLAVMARKALGGTK